MVSNASSRGAAPVVVGITTYVERARYGVWDHDAALLPRPYLDCVVRAGGVPVLLPPIGSAPEVLDRVDALVLAGGADIEPSRYGQPAHERTANTRPERDAAELMLVRAALEAGLPVLGVCRGMELLNVALGGTLTQHLPDLAASTEHQPAVATFGANRITLAAGSTVAGVLGLETACRCYHHQAVDRLGEGLRPVGWAEDGTVEAVELPEEAFVVGVQWHPEQDIDDTRLFAALVDTARRRQGRRAPVA